MHTLATHVATGMSDPTWVQRELDFDDSQAIPRDAMQIILDMPDDLPWPCPAPSPYNSRRTRRAVAEGKPAPKTTVRRSGPPVRPQPYDRGEPIEQMRSDLPWSVPAGSPVDSARC